jgi:hypothetical protein
MAEAILRDVRFAARGLRRNPGFTAAAVLTLALGIGATTAVFGVVYGVIFRPLPFPNADRLVRVVQLLPEGPGRPATFRAGLTPDQITEWRATSRTLAEIGYASPRPAALTGAGTPVRLYGADVSVSLFRALGVAPLRGRIFADDDAQPGNEHVVVLSHDTWRTRFGASEDIVDRSIDDNAVVFNATTMEALLARTVASPRLYSATAAGFAIVAVALAALGLYGVLSYSIGTRTREFGIRIALGASPKTVIKRVMREALGTVSLGVAVGIAGALYLSRFLEAILFGVQPRDPVTLGAVAILFLAVAGLACYIPARRATRVDPVVALRAE